MQTETERGIITRLTVLLLMICVIQARVARKPCNEKIPDSANCEISEDSCVLEDMLVYCQRYCGVCDTTSTVPTTTPVATKRNPTSCVDTDPIFCLQQRELGLCSSDQEFKSNCPRACGLCSVDTERPTSPATKEEQKCFDENPQFCQSTKNGCSDEEFRNNCRLTCGACTNPIPNAAKEVIPATTVGLPTEVMQTGKPKEANSPSVKPPPAARVPAARVPPAKSLAAGVKEQPGKSSEAIPTAVAAEIPESSGYVIRGHAQFIGLVLSLYALSKFFD